MSLPQSSRLSEVPVVHKTGPIYGAYVADIANKPIRAHQVIQAVAFQKTLDYTSGQTLYTGVTAQPVQAADVAASGTKLFNAIQGASFPEEISGTGILESYGILGVSLVDAVAAPDDFGTRFDSVSDMTQYTYGSEVGGFETRKVSYITKGQVWIEYQSDANFPTIGQGVTLSATEDGRVVALTDRATNICIGLTRGYYQRGTSKYVLVELTPDRW